MCNSTKYPSLPPITGLKIQRGWPVSNAKIFKEKYVLAKPEFPEERVGGQIKTPSVWNGVEDFWRTYGQIYFFEINTSLIWTLTDPFTVLPITAA